MNCYLIETYNLRDGKCYYPQFADSSTEAREIAQRNENRIEGNNTKVLSAVLMTLSEVNAAGLDAPDFEDDFDFDGEEGAFESDEFFL
jgi:hypothetical protein